MGIETKTVKLDMSSKILGKSPGARELERLLKEGWEIVSERKSGALEWGYKTEFTLRRIR
jgi:hypothetical protein